LDFAGDETKSLEITDMSMSESDRDLSSLDMSLTHETSPEKKVVHPMAFTIEFDDGPNTFGISDSISKFVPKHLRTGSSKADRSLTDGESSSKRTTTTTTPKPFMPVRLRQIDVNKSQVNSKLPKASNSNSTSTDSKLKSSRVKSLDLSNVETKPNVQLRSSVEKDKIRSSTEKTRIQQPKPRPKSMQPEDYLVRRESPHQVPDENLHFVSPVVDDDILPIVQRVHGGGGGGGTTGPKLSKKLPTDEAKGKANPSGDQQEEASSETGTYTIENDDDDPTAAELEKARSSIDKVFGMELVEQSRLQHQEIITAISRHSSKANSPSPVLKEVLHRKGSAESEWIREWAEQAAMQQERDNGEFCN
jgi:hypothetical protein